MSDCDLLLCFHALELTGSARFVDRFSFRRRFSFTSEIARYPSASCDFANSDGQQRRDSTDRGCRAFAGPSSDPA
jgi:hypothetical protein